MILTARLFVLVVLLECEDGIGSAISIGWVGRLGLELSLESLARSWH